MRRSTIAFDRFAAFVAAVVLLAAGAAAIIWWWGIFSQVPDTVDLSGVQDLSAQPWWPWAVGIVGVVLVLLGLRWLFAHVPNRGVGELKLPGSNGQGKLRASAGPVGKAAAVALEGVPGVRSSHGTVIRERGQLVARLSATIDPGADLHRIATGADQVAADVGQVLQRDDLRCQVQLKVATRARSLPRLT